MLKTDESSEAMTVGTTGPMARATNVGILARAWVVSNAGGQRERDTGDIRADEVIAVDRIQGVWIRGVRPFMRPMPCVPPPVASDSNWRPSCSAMPRPVKSR